MAKEIRNFKLSELTCTVPEKGQYENLPYDYSDLKQSLIDKGYKPEDYDYIAVQDDGKVLYGGRRVWLMQKDMSMDQSTEIACEIWTRAEFDASLVARLAIKDYFPGKDSKGKIKEPKVKKHSLGVLEGYPNLVKLHKRKSNISGYDYDLKNSAGEKIDAGKS
tara:strand:+ start:348 stop:836 length:489 start_codon:yes stop_codon:yes gene_type:complete